MIALFLPNLMGGGAERVLLHLARGMTEAGVAVDLVLAAAEGEYVDQVPPRVNVVDLRTRRVRHCIGQLKSYLDARQPVAMLSAISHANVAALLAARLSTAKVRTAVGVHVAYSRESSGTSLKGFLRKRLTRYFYSQSDRIIAVSAGAADDLSRFLGIRRERIEVVYNPVLVPEMAIRGDADISHPWFRTGEKPVILGIGRLTRQKDFETLIRAFARAREQVESRLLILGTGEDRAKLGGLVREKGLEREVDLPGFVDNPFAYMKRSHLFVLSSRWEGFGNVLVEAMSFGLPVVSTDCESGPREILEGGKHGRLVPVGDEKQLAEAIVDALRNPRDPSAEEARKRRAARFTYQQASEEYLKLLL